jgi:hypothetical protein
MQRNRQYFTTAVSFPGATFKGVSASEITRTVPSRANQRHGDDLGRYKAQQQRDVPNAIKTGAMETGAIEISAVGIKDVSSRPDRLLAPAFLRAGLLAHLKRTFR